MKDEDIKEGDVVRVRQWGDMANEFGVYNNGNIYINSKRTCFLLGYKNLCGEVGTVVRKRYDNHEHRYIYSFQEEKFYSTPSWLMCSEMLEPVIEEEWELADDEQIKPLFYC